MDISNHQYYYFAIFNFVKHLSLKRFAQLCPLTLKLISVPKGQLISKAIYSLLTSSKKRTDKFVLFAFLLFPANKSNSSVCFLGESTACQSAF